MPVFIDFNSGWLFHEGDITVSEPAYKGAMYMGAKTQRALIGPAAYAYNDSPDSYSSERELKSESWSCVTLPHDYIISQTPSPEHNSALGYFDYHSAWYRRHFTVPQGEWGRVALIFDGVSSFCEVWVNGCYMSESRTGYVPFEVDITDIVRPGDNVVAVYVRSDRHEGWWYEGAGITRKVRLSLAAGLSAALYGIYVHPEKLSDAKWIVPVELTVRNDTDAVRRAYVRCEIIASGGNEIGEMSGEVDIAPYGSADVKMETAISSPELWQLDCPALYTLKATISDGEESVDEYETSFGFRTAEWRADGFYLNGRKEYLRGVCCHQDFGLTGRVIAPNIHRYRLRLMREMGANALRTSHYMNAEETIDAADRLGILVMDETRWFESTPDGISQLETLVRRDRSHPSVILWSLGNEEPMHATENGRKIAKKLHAALRSLDDRAVTAAVSVSPEKAQVNDIVDVIGVNYNRGAFDALRAKYPDKAIISTECCAVGSSRGWYMADDAARGYQNAFDSHNDSADWFGGREQMQKFVLSHPYIAGEFQWAGIEHRGETRWPRLCSVSGAVDMFLCRKDAFWQNMSHWSAQPMVHILPHLNLDGREGEQIDAWVYTNCPECELFCDGISLGRKQIEPGGHYSASYTYPASELYAVGYGSDGREAAREVINRAGKPVSLTLKWLNADDFAFDGRDLALISCRCVDENGVLVPDASPFVSFYTSGGGVIAATGSDDCDHVPPSCPDRKMYMGEITAAVRASSPVRVYARADGLTSSVIEIG